MKRLTGAAVGLGAAVLLYLAAWPVPIDPLAWQAPEFDPARFVPTGSLDTATRVTIADGHGPEDVDVDARGRVVVGLADGRLLRWSRPEAVPERWIDTEGRPLGLDWDADGRLWIADADRGLLSVDAGGALRVETTTCAGRKLVFTDDLEIASDGRVYFSDASEGFAQANWKLDIIESQPRGRLCVFDPRTRETTELLGELHFANGVALAPDDTFVLVNETSRYRVRKLWLTGPRRGQHEVIIDNLPGFPDGISRGTGGTYWIAIASPRNPLVDGASDSPWLRKVMIRLPTFLQPTPERTARVLGIDADGRVKHDLYDPGGTRIHLVTSVQERNGRLYLGSLVDDGWAYVAVP